MMLISGIVLWSVLHLSLALKPDWRAGLVQRVGAGPFKGMFSLLLLGALALIVLGWKAFPATSLYVPPAGLRHLTMLLMPLAVILFFAARLPTNLKQIIRHPQLTGVKLWAVAHLLANGETRSVLLFTGLLAWAVLEVIFINRRDGAWQKPAPAGSSKTVLQVIIALIITAALIFAHPWLAGVALIPA